MHRRTEEACEDYGLNFIGDSEFEFNVSEYTSEVLTNAMHINELVKNNRTNLRIDYKVSGIGSNSCGPCEVFSVNLPFCGKKVCF